MVLVIVRPRSIIEKLARNEGIQNPSTFTKQHHMAQKKDRKAGASSSSQM